MTDRIVVALQKPVNGPPQLYLMEPSTHGTWDQPLALDPAEVDRLAELAGAPQDPEQQEDRMEKFGRALFDKLMAHPAFESSVSPLLHLNPAQREPFYLYFQHRMPTVEQLPWEALFAPHVGFLSQNQDFAVARMLNTNNAKTEWLYEPPLKMVAVLAASGAVDERIDATDQWERLWSAIQDTRLPIRVQVLTCQLALRDQVNEAGRKEARGGEPRVTAELIHDRDDLFARIGAFAPHILHFFCHGVATTRPQLQVGTFRDWETEVPGSILIEGEQLRQNADPEGNIWLVTLNCCDSARDGAGGSWLSMPVACNLVSGGIPVAVGMRERIDQHFANDFCKLFYETLFAELVRRLEEAKQTGSTDVHWACGLFKVRQSMHANLKADPAWTVPVMHTRLGRFQLKLNPAQVRDAGFPATPAAVAPTAQGLSAQAIHEYGEELLQLYEDRKLFAALPAVTARIDQRIADINQALGA